MYLGVLFGFIGIIMEAESMERQSIWKVWESGYIQILDTPV